MHGTRQEEKSLIPADSRINPAVFSGSRERGEYDGIHPMGEVRAHLVPIFFSKTSL